MNAFAKAKAVLLMMAVSAQANPDYAAAEENRGDVGAPAFLSEGKRPGSSYCTWSPDFKCYEDGQPKCCDRPEKCPKERPRCDKNQRDGSSYCTWSPDFKCYKKGAPKCCDRPENCPEKRPGCDIKPTRRPTRRPERRPTKRPTRRPTGRRPTRECVDEDRPRPVRNGQRFRFNLVDENAQCVDGRDRLYEWGQSNGIDTFSKCAEYCVNNTPSSLATGGSFRGYDFNCNARTCRCLYDQGTLDSRNSGRFDRTNRNEPGRGSISGTTGMTGTFCGKLVGAEFLEEAVAEA